MVSIGPERVRVTDEMVSSAKCHTRGNPAISDVRLRLSCEVVLLSFLPYTIYYTL